MELFKHIGLDRHINFTSETLFVKTKGIIVLSCLVVYLIHYHYISIFCSFLRFNFNDASRTIKRVATSGFWDLSLWFMKLNHVEIIVSGDSIDDESAVIISNHQSLADHFVLAYLARRATINDESSVKNANSIVQPRINFFTWFRIWRVPTIRLLLNIAKCDENWELDKTLSDSMFEPLLKSDEPEWLILFPEVNIWTEDDAILQMKQSEKYFLPVLKNVLYPRFSSFVNSIEAIKTNKNSAFTRVYDITLLYYRTDLTTSNQDSEKPDDSNILNIKHIFEAPSLLDIFSSRSKYTVRVHIRARTFTRIPKKRNRLEKWLEKTWCVKDKTIDQMSKSIKVSLVES